MLTSMLLAAQVGLLAPATVGDLVVSVADLKGLRHDTPAVAMEELRRSGYRMPPVALGTTLTESEVVRIGNAIGLHLAMGNPTSAFDRERMDRFVRAVGSDVAASTTPSSSGESSGSKRKPRSKSPKKPGSRHHGHGHGHRTQSDGDGIR